MTDRRIEGLQTLVSDTNALAVAERERTELVVTLQPIAERISAHVKFADQVTVRDKEQADAAAKYREGILLDADLAETSLRNFNGKLIERLFRTHRQWTALLGLFSGPLAQAASKVKRAVMDWEEAERQKAFVEQQRLQAAADKAARRERERLEKEAAKLKTPEKREQRLEQAAQVVASVIRVAAPTSGVKSQRRWKVTSVDPAAFVKAAAANKTLLGYLTVEVGKLERAKANNTMFEAEGIRFDQISV